MALEGRPVLHPRRKSLPVTCTEVLARLKKPPTVIKESRLHQNYLRFRISPEPTVALGTTIMAPAEEMSGQKAELVASRQPGAGEVDAYERVLGDAMKGDATLFAREDYVEEAWRIVDPVLKAGDASLRLRARHLGTPGGGATVPPGWMERSEDRRLTSRNRICKIRKGTKGRSGGPRRRDSSRPASPGRVLAWPGRRPCARSGRGPGGREATGAAGRPGIGRAT